MTLTATRYEHIVLNDEKIPIIAGTTMKVIELVVEQMAYGWSPAELHFQHPYLTLGQIHSALAYDWDHTATLDAEIAWRDALVDAIQQQAQPTPLQERLKARGLI